MAVTAKQRAYQQRSRHGSGISMAAMAKAAKMAARQQRKRISGMKASAWQLMQHISIVMAASAGGRRRLATT